MSTYRLSVDKALVQRGLCLSIEEARNQILSGSVHVNGSIVLNAARQVSAQDELIIKLADQFVSRGGFKLEAALANFDIEVRGKRALDAGASTGGFTDCLLQRGIYEVVAVDVGKGQLHEKIAKDPRVKVIDSFNIRQLVEVELPDEFSNPFDIVVADLSFISLKSVAPALRARLSDDGDLVVLVKPQFEATKQEVDKGKGIISDQGIRDRVLDEVGESLQNQGLRERGRIESPIRGAEGNVEYLVWYKFEA